MTDHTPAWLLDRLDTVLTALVDGTAWACVHVDVDSPMMAASWRPGVIACFACAPELLRWTSTDDLACTACGTVPGSDKGTTPGWVQTSRLRFEFMICGACDPGVPLDVGSR